MRATDDGERCFEPGAERAVSGKTSERGARDGVPFAQADVDTWKSPRLGAAIDAELMPRVKITVDAAYLPNVEVSATNVHYLRNLLSPEWGDGRGVQLDAILSYALTDVLKVGVAGRYWSMWTTSGATDFTGLGTIVPMRFAAEQPALLVQGAYTLDALATGAD